MNLPHLEDFSTLTISLIISVLLVLATMLTKRSMRNAIHRYGEKHSFRLSRTLLIEKFTSFSLVMLLLMALLFLWGISVQSVFVALPALLGVLGVAFFAQWSFLSNIFAAFLLFFTAPLKIGDLVRIGDGPAVEGMVEDMSLFYVILKDAEGNEVSIPNNMILQKVVTRLKNPTGKTGA